MHRWVLTKLKTATALAPTLKLIQQQQFDIGRHIFE